MNRHQYSAARGQREPRRPRRHPRVRPRERDWCRFIFLGPKNERTPINLFRVRLRRQAHRPRIRLSFLYVSRDAMEAARVVSTPGDATAIPEGGRCSHHQADTPGCIAIGSGFRWGLVSQGIQPALWRNHGLGQGRSIVALLFARWFQILRDPALTFISAGNCRGKRTWHFGNGRNAGRFGLTRLPTDFSGFGVAVGWLGDLGRGTRGQGGADKVLAEADRSGRTRRATCRCRTCRGG